MNGTLMKAAVITLAVSVAFASPVVSAGGRPCSGSKGGVSHCENGRFVCRDGTVSQSKRVCEEEQPKGNSTANKAGRVVGVMDGDTIAVLTSGRVQVKVRLAEIDAPEKAQPFGAKSKQSLSDLCFDKTATLTSLGEDRYKRTLARVTCAGVDANAEQVQRGMAWVYRQYAPKDSPLYAVENEARAARRGLWVDPSPTAPWEWRHR